MMRLLLKKDCSTFKVNALGHFPLLSCVYEEQPELLRLLVRFRCFKQMFHFYSAFYSSYIVRHRSSLALMSTKQIPTAKTHSSLQLIVSNPRWRVSSSMQVHAKRHDVPKGPQTLREAALPFSILRDLHDCYVLLFF